MAMIYTHDEIKGKHINSSYLVTFKLSAVKSYSEMFLVSKWSTRRKTRK